MNLVASKKALIINFLVVGWYCSPDKIDNHSECQLLLILSSLLKYKINYSRFPDFPYDFLEIEFIEINDYQITDIGISEKIDENLILTRYLTELFLEAELGYFSPSPENGD